MRVLCPLRLCESCVHRMCETQGQGSDMHDGHEAGLTPKKPLFSCILWAHQGWRLPPSNAPAAPLTSVPHPAPGTAAASLPAGTGLLLKLPVSFCLWSFCVIDADCTALQHTGPAADAVCAHVSAAGLVLQRCRSGC